MGMTRAQVQALYSQAQALPSDSGEPSLLVEFALDAHNQARLAFRFDGNALKTVGLLVRSQQTYPQALVRYEELVQQMQRTAVPRGPVASRRSSPSLDAQPSHLMRIPRQATDAWTTADGVKVNGLVFEHTAKEQADITWTVDASRPLALQRMQQDDEARAQARAQQEAAFGKFLDGMVGKNIGVLAKRWGAPHSVTPMPDGDVIYLWEDVRGDTPVCRTSVFARKNGRIHHWQASGRQCSTR